MNHPFYLLSNASTDVFPENTLTNFKNKLPKDLIFSEEDKWAVGIETIGISSQFRNIKVPPNNVPSLFAGHVYNRLEDYRVFQPGQTQELHKSMHFILERGQNGLMGVDILDQYYTKADIYSMCALTNVRFKPWCSLTYDNNRLTISYTDVFNNNHPGVWFFMHETFASSFQFNAHKIRDAQVHKPDPDNNSNEVAVVEIGPTLYFQRKVVFKGETYFGYFLARDPQRKYYKPLVSDYIDVTHQYLPELIKVQMNIIEPQILNSEYSQDLLVISPDLKYTNRYFFHEIENISYCPLLFNDIRVIQIKLVDEKNELLQLVKGHATIVKIRFRRNLNMSDTFYCRVTSKRNEVYPKNKPACFSVQLPTTKVLNDDWKVSLNSINVPNQFTTFLPGSDTKHSHLRTMIVKRTKVPSIWLVFKKNIAYTPSRLIADLNVFLDVYDYGSATIDELGRAVINFEHDDCTLALGLDLAKVLGYHTGVIANFEGSDWMYLKPFSDSPKKIVFESPINTDYLKPNYFVVYSNIVQPSIIGNQFSPILKVVPVLNSQEPFKLYDFKQREFYNIANTEINEIKMELRTHDGEFVNFLSDQHVVMNLQFTNEINPNK